MKKIFARYLLLSLAGLPFTSTNGQTYDLLYVERNVFLTQTGVSSTEAPSWTFENGGNGNYYFLAGGEISGRTPASLSVTNGATSLPFSYDAVSILPLSAYFYDGFDTGVGTFDINTGLGARQGGGDAPLAWLANVADQTTDYHQQIISNGVVSILQIAGDGALPNAMVSPDLDFTLLWEDKQGFMNVAGKRMQVVMDALTNIDGSGYYSHAAMTVASNAPLAQAGQAGSGFSVVFIEDDFGGSGNFIQIWDGDTMLANNIPNPNGAGSAFLEIFADDPTDGNPWNGSGSTVMVVRIEGSEIFRYEKTGGGYTANYVTLEGFMQSNGAQLATHTFEEFTVFWGRTTGSSLPATTEVEVERSFASAGELESAFPSGNYEFVSNSGTVATIPMGGMALPTVNPIKEYELLQFLDPSFDLTISWDAYVKNPAAADAFLTIEVSYWDESTGEDVLLWETPNLRDSDLIPGIDPTATSVTIPANTLTGSPTGNYSILVFYGDIMSLETAGATTSIWLESIELHVPVQVQPESNTWAGYPVGDMGWVQTGSFLGLINANFSDQGWIWNTPLNSYIYIQESWVTEAGSWTYIPKP